MARTRKHTHNINFAHAKAGVHFTLYGINAPLAHNENEYGMIALGYAICHPTDLLFRIYTLLAMRYVYFESVD